MKAGTRVTIKPEYLINPDRPGPVGTVRKIRTDVEVDWDDKNPKIWNPIESLDELS